MSTTMKFQNESSPLRNGDTYDVIVVGARVAGAATAMLLARNGLRTLLLDRSPLGKDTLSTHALMRGAVVQLSRWGLLDDVIAAGTPAVRKTSFTYRDDRIVLDLKPAAGVDALYAPRRTVLDPILVGGAVGAGVDVHHGATVSNLIWRNGAVTGIKVITEDSRVVELTARLVIGADGIRSTVARLVDAPVTRTGRHAGAATYGYWSDFDSDGFEWIFRPEGCAGVIPTNDGRVCVFAGASPASIGRGGVRVIETTIANGAPDIAERLRTAKAPKGTRTWGGHVGFLRRPSGPGWALVGDAGYFKDPISAHGITDALRDAELLARAVADGWSDARSLATSLAEYEATRDRLSLPLFEITDRIAGQQWDDADIAGILLELSASMAHEVQLLAALDTEPAPAEVFA
jgi:flavin-dependent dehydrogenase